MKLEQCLLDFGVTASGQLAEPSRTLSLVDTLEKYTGTPGKCSHEHAPCLTNFLTTSLASTGTLDRQNCDQQA